MKELKDAGIAAALGVVAAAALAVVLPALLGPLGLFITLGVWPLAFVAAWAIAFVALDGPPRERS